MKPGTILIDNSSKIFVLEDPLLKTHVVKDESEQIKLEIEYPYKTPILFAFLFSLNEENLPREEVYYINEDKDMEKIQSYSKTMIQQFIEDKVMIYNGSYYKLIN